MIVLPRMCVPNTGPYTIQALVLFVSQLRFGRAVGDPGGLLCEDGLWVNHGEH